jgi:hypothetical protein
MIVLLYKFCEEIGMVSEEIAYLPEVSMLIDDDNFGIISQVEWRENETRFRIYKINIFLKPKW